MIKVHDRWVYLMIGAIALLFLGLIYAWSIFKAPFMEIYPKWSAPALSATFTISMVFFCLGGIFSGQLMKRIKPMVILCLSAISLFIGFFGVSMMQGAGSRESLYMLYVFYGFFCGGGVGIGYNCVISTVNKWFPDRAGLSSGVLMLGFGFGGLLFGGLVNILIGRFGLFCAFRILAVVAAFILTSASFFMRPPQAESEDNGPTIDGSQNYETKEMFKEPRFWLFVLWAVTQNSAGLIVIGSAASIALAFGAPALLGLLVSVFNGAGRVLFGSLYDKCKRKRTILADTVFILSAGILLTLGAFVDSVFLIFLGLLVTGTGYGGVPAITSAFVHSEFGPKFFPANFSIATSSLIPAAIIGPMISSFLIEKSGGSYNSTFIMIVVLGTSAAIAWHLINLKARA